MMKCPVCGKEMLRGTVACHLVRSSYSSLRRMMFAQHYSGKGS